jgi:hypothetical protein
LTGRDGGKDFRMGQRNAGIIAIGSRHHEADHFAGLNRNVAIPDRADADLGTLKILENADRTFCLSLQRADGTVDSGVILMRPMTEVEPEGINAR